MAKFSINYVGQARNARKAMLELEIADEKELAMMNDEQVEKMINESDYFVFEDSEADGFVIVPKELSGKLTWIIRY